MFNPILPNVNKTHDHLSPQITWTILYHDICQVLSGLERLQRCGGVKPGNDITNF